MLGEAINNLTIRISASTSGLDKSLNNVKTKLSTIGKDVTRLGSKISLAVTTPIAGLGAFAVKEAANMEGAMSKFNVVFKGGTDEMLRWVETYRSEFPLARGEIIKMSADLQDLLVPMGLNRGEASGMVQEWMHLAGALAAFNDVPIEQALNAIRSGIAGESEPLKQFGINASVAAIEQEALNLGLIKAGEEMNAQVKQQALLSLAYKQSSDAVNGLEEQKGSLLWVLQEIKAIGKDVASTFGNDMLPYVKKLADYVKNLSLKFSNLSTHTRMMIFVIAGLVAAIGPVLMLIGAMSTGLGMVAGAIGFLISPIGIIIVAIGALVGAFLYFYNTNEEFRLKLTEIWNAIAKYFTDTFNSILLAVEEFVNGAKVFWNNFGDEITVIANIFKEMFVANIQIGIEQIKTIFGVFIEFVKGVFKIFGNILEGDTQGAIQAFKEMVEGMFTNIKNGFNNVYKIIENTFNNILDLLDIDPDTIVEVFERILERVTSIFTEGIPNTIKSGINGMISLLNNGINSVNKLINGVNEYSEHIGVTIPTIPKIPMLANGGIVTSPTLAMIGEGAEAEAVIPLSKLNGMIGNGKGRVDIRVFLDKHQIAAAIGQPLMERILVTTGARI